MYRVVCQIMTKVEAESEEGAFNKAPDNLEDYELEPLYAERIRT